jgi:hypothetical protein
VNSVAGFLLSEDLVAGEIDDCGFEAKATLWSLKMKRTHEFYIFVALAMLVSLAFEQVSAQQKTTGNLTGTVIDQATRAPLAGVNVIVIDTKLGAVTDANGHLKFSILQQENTACAFDGLQRKLLPMLSSLRTRQKLGVALEETAIEIGEVIVTPKAEKYDATGIRAIEQKTVVEAPGSAQDIFWVIQTLPESPPTATIENLCVRRQSG